MPDYYFPEVNTSGQFTDPKVNTYIETLAKNALATALAAKRGVEPTELGTEHLDTVVVPDVYSQSSNLESTLESGYPTTRAGILIVERSASRTMVWQTYIPYTPTVTTPQQEFSRSYYQGNWTPWVSSQTMAWESYALFTEDLNTLVEPRIYSQASNSRATIETNYPVTWAGILEVTANNSRYIVRQVYRPYANSRVAIGETWTRSMYNGSWSAWERSDGRAILPEGGTTNQVLTAGTNGNLQWGPVINSSSSTLTGPGRPDTPSTTGGIITGNEPVGTEYRSTDGASVGAWVWRKRPGGWAVTDGDTGWRDVTSFVIDSTGASAVSSGSLRMRRIGGVIHATTAGQRLTMVAGLSGIRVNHPEGFAPADSGSPWFWGGWDRNTVYALFSRSADWWPNSGPLSPFGSGISPITSHTWPARSSAWPTTLPGTPA